jgi:hypothetical protein
MNYLFRLMILKNKYDAVNLFASAGRISVQTFSLKLDGTPYFNFSTISRFIFHLSIYHEVNITHRKRVSLHIMKAVSKISNFL